MNPKRKDEGFTLIEIIIVILLLGMIAALVGPRLFRKMEGSKAGIARTQIAMMEGALKLFKLDTGRFPSTAEGLRALMEAPPGLRNWDGPYLEKGLPRDPWDRPYQYAYPGKHYLFDLYSLGADGTPGGEGENRDVGNWEDAKGRS